MQSYTPPTIVVVAGAASNTGKTTLLCGLLRELTRDAPWEAIKLTRGHYRSCGKDPQACCVSHLLGEAPTVRSGRAETYAVGKDTGRYWDAGARNVHWVIATDTQVEQGIREALGRVRTGRVLIEGTSVLRYVTAACALLTVRPEADQKLKASARRALAAGRVDALVAWDAACEVEQLLPVDVRMPLPLLTLAALPDIAAFVRQRLAGATPPTTYSLGLTKA